MVDYCALIVHRMVNIILEIEIGGTGAVEQKQKSWQPGDRAASLGGDGRI
jgi:hypothetical protein